MEKRTEIKEAVKNEVIKLMALELKQEDTFKQMQRELADELFKLSPKEDSEENPTVQEEVKSTKLLRTLNANLGYDPVNANEERMKKFFGFIYNPKDLKRGFVGDEITPEEEEFMKNSIFTKNSMIEELETKLDELKKEVRTQRSKISIDSKAEIIKDFEKAENKITDKTAAEKLTEFKNEFYGEKVKNNLVQALSRSNKFSEDYKELLNAPPTEAPVQVIPPIIEASTEVADKDIELSDKARQVKPKVKRNKTSRKSKKKN